MICGFGAASLYLGIYYHEPITKALALGFGLVSLVGATCMYAAHFVFFQRLSNLLTQGLIT